MAVETWIIDSSALHKLGSSPDLQLWLERIERGLVTVASVTLLELGYSARSREDFNKVFTSSLMRNLIELASTRQSEALAREIQEKLVDTSQHRGVSIPDLLIAALGVVEGHTVLHDDKDFALISTVTQQPTERLRL